MATSEDTSARPQPWDGPQWSRLNMTELSREGIASDIEADGAPSWWQAVGYPDPNTLEFEDFWSRYQLKAVGRGIVDLLVEDTWQENVDVVDRSDDSEDTGFERDVEALLSGDMLRRQPVHRFVGVDTLATIGEYAVLVLGVDDGRDMSQPLPGIEEGDEVDVAPSGVEPGEVAGSGVVGSIGGHDVSPGIAEMDDVSSGFERLQYVTPYSQDRILDIDLDERMTSERYNLPKMYQIDTRGNEGVVADSDVDTDSDSVEDVHWTRVIHVVEGGIEGDVSGDPFLRPFWHELLNIDKITAASSEGYWRAGYTGYVIRPPTDENGVPIGGVDTDGPGSGEVQRQMEKYYSNFDRDIATRGTVESLSQSLPSPTEHFELNYRNIANETSIPMSILMGNERGDMATREDRRKYRELIAGRRNRYAEVMILRPVLNRLIACGIMRPPEGNGYGVEWPDLHEPSEKTRAETSNTWASALATLGGGDPRRIATRKELRDVVGWDPLSEDEKPAVSLMRRMGGSMTPTRPQSVPSSQDSSTGNGGNDGNNGDADTDNQQDAVMIEGAEQIAEQQQSPPPDAVRNHVQNINVAPESAKDSRDEDEFSEDEFRW